MTKTELQGALLRRQWMAAALDGTPPPIVTAAVRRHFEREFSRAYPGRSLTCESMPEKAHNRAAVFTQNSAGQV